MNLRKKGLINALYDGVFVIVYGIASHARRLVLLSRGVILASRVGISGSAVFFQSRSHAISVGTGSEIGHGVRIKAGFDGTIIIGKNVLIDDYTFISAHKSIRVGDNSMISAQCYLVDFCHKMPLSDKKSRSYSGMYVSDAIRIGSNVWIGTHAVILPGVTVGDRAVIGAGSVVTKDVPADSVAVGNPAKIIRTHEK